MGSVLALLFSRMGLMIGGGLIAASLAFFAGMTVQGWREAAARSMLNETITERTDTIAELRLELQTLAEGRAAAAETARKAQERLALLQQSRLELQDSNARDIERALERALNADQAIPSGALDPADIVSLCNILRDTAPNCHADNGDSRNP